MLNINNSCNGRGCKAGDNLPYDGNVKHIYSRMLQVTNDIKALLFGFNVYLDEELAKRKQMEALDFKTFRALHILPNGMGAYCHMSKFSSPDVDYTFEFRFTICNN